MSNLHRIFSERHLHREITNIHSHCSETVQFSGLKSCDHQPSLKFIKRPTGYSVGYTYKINWKILRKSTLPFKAQQTVNSWFIWNCPHVNNQNSSHCILNEAQHIELDCIVSKMSNLIEKTLSSTSNAHSTNV